MDPTTYITGGIGLTVVGSLAAVVIALIRAQGSPAKNADAVVKAATKRAEDAERTARELQREVNGLWRQLNAALSEAAAAERRAASAEVQRDAAVAEAERQRNTLGGLP